MLLRIPCLLGLVAQGALALPPATPVVTTSAGHRQTTEFADVDVAMEGTALSCTEQDLVFSLARMGLQRPSDVAWPLKGMVKHS